MVCNLTRLGGRGQKTNQILQTSHKKSPHPQNCIDQDTPPYIATEAPSTESICSNPPRINESNLAPLCGEQEQPSSGGTSAAVDSARNGQSGFSVSGGTSPRRTAETQFPVTRGAVVAAEAEADRADPRAVLPRERARFLRVKGGCRGQSLTFVLPTSKRPQIRRK